MTDQGGVRIDGARELRASMKAAGVSLGDMTDVHREVGAIVLPVAKSTTPIGPEVGGHLVTTVRVGATRSATILRAGTATRRYGPPIHWGWFRRGIKPNPWLSRAAQSTEPTWTARYMAGVEAIIKKIRGMNP